MSGSNVALAEPLFHAAVRHRARCRSFSVLVLMGLSVAALLSWMPGTAGTHLAILELLAISAIHGALVSSCTCCGCDRCSLTRRAAAVRRLSRKEAPLPHRDARSVQDDRDCQTVRCPTVVKAPELGPNAHRFADDEASATAATASDHQASRATTPG
eukprot:gnl/TRDRNA2_/TRDRNA2_82251_c0_seq1.p1 gnl/TRDRNA2_/TRDRNA2_82251_c0~~gnl/TRDRNA2_/TRDRNA2_82251_c0_seq1.p1  ORF type:complete len:157 (-),score=16.88 gnl/TRDRNA2_/TRDRNA2_82251_c0_seq1:438-908(-)